MHIEYNKTGDLHAPVSGNGSTYDLVVFCHLRWDFVYQRPQHIISRLAKSLKVLFIEEPWHRPGQDGSTLIEVNPSLHVLQPNVHHIEEIGGVLPLYTDKKIGMGWFYSASFLPLLDYFSFDKVVYDCMDELSLFKGAPEKLVRQERCLMEQADIVFTGGKSLYESKVRHHTHVYCFPSSVDREHFAQALNGLAIPDDIALIRNPIVGYFGVIDERIDLNLLNETALLRPGINFVMIGPLAKISEHDLPRQHNIHYLGMKNYGELPGYLKAFSIAMMPFALNDATKYISPTKTLEYMAAGKPIISTAVHDVVRDYSKELTVISNADGFSKAIDTLLAYNNALAPTNYHKILEHTSWDATVKKMQEIMKNTVRP